jgi:hypothetical protein
MGGRIQLASSLRVPFTFVRGGFPSLNPRVDRAVRWLMLGLAICLSLGEGQHALLGIEAGHAHRGGVSAGTCQAGHGERMSAGHNAAPQARRHGNAARSCTGTASNSDCIFHRSARSGLKASASGRASRSETKQAAAIASAEIAASSNCPVCDCLSLASSFVAISPCLPAATLVADWRAPSLPSLRLFTQQNADPRGPPVA